MATAKATPPTTPSKDDSLINFEGLKSIEKKFATINAFVNSGKEVPTELTKNFVIFPLSDDPYSELE